MRRQKLDVSAITRMSLLASVPAGDASSAAAKAASMGRAEEHADAGSAGCQGPLGRGPLAGPSLCLLRRNAREGERVI